MRKTRYKKITYQILGLVLAFSLGMTAFATEKIDQQIDEQRKEIEETRQELSDAEEKQEQLLRVKAEMESYLSGLNQQYHTITERIADLEQQIWDKESEIRQTQTELEAATRTAKQQYEDMKARIQYLYEYPQAGFFELLLMEGNFAKALTRASHVASLASYDRQKMDDYIAVKEAIAQKELELKGEKEALDTLHAEVAAKQHEVENLVHNTKGEIGNQITAIAKAQAEIDGKESTLEDQKAVLEELLAEKRRIEAEIEAQKLQEIQNSLGSVSGHRITEPEYVQYGAYPATEEEVTALAVLIHCEAANQGDEGRLAVGAVVMNRIRDPRFAQKDILSVIRAGGQFSPVTSGRFDLILTQSLGSVSSACFEAARRAIAGESNVGNRVFFRTYANQPALSGLVIGAHIFSYTWNFSTV